MQDNVMSNGYVASNNSKTNTMSNVVDLLKHALHFIRNILLTLLIFITFIISIVLVDKGINVFRNEKLPALLDTYVIATPSMTPTIKVDDAILVRRVDYKSLKKGDIITFKSSDSRLNGMVITHRINEVITDENGNITFVTKGDNNKNVDDAQVLPENIYGKVMVKVPFYSAIKKTISNPIVISLVIVVMVALIVNRNKKSKKIEKEEEIELLTFDEEAIEII